MSAQRQLRQNTGSCERRVLRRSRHLCSAVMGNHVSPLPSCASMANDDTKLNRDSTAKLTNCTMSDSSDGVVSDAAVVCGASGAGMCVKRSDVQ